MVVEVINCIVIIVRSWGVDLYDRDVKYGYHQADYDSIHCVFLILLSGCSTEVFPSYLPLPKMFQRYLPIYQFFQFPCLSQGYPVQIPIKMFFLVQLLHQFGDSLLLDGIPAFRVRIKRHLPEPDVPQLTRSLIHANVSCSHGGSPQLPPSGGLLMGTASIPPRDGSRCSHYLAPCTYPVVMVTVGAPRA